MRAVVQRVSKARVYVNGTELAGIGRGLLVLLGVAKADDHAAARSLAEKVSGLRIFEDQNDKMNLSVKEVNGALLVVSQFTLYGSVKHSKRPSFDAAARPEEALRLYEFFVQEIRQHGVPCETGLFQAKTSVELINEGPVTILLDSESRF